MREKLWKNRKILFIIIFGFLAIIVLLISFFGESNVDNKIKIVKSSSKFYTVSGCVNRYLNYLYSEDVDSLLILIDKSYKNNNNINKNNFFDKIGKLDNLYTFEARKIYEQVINDNITKYYVKGYLLEEGINSNLSVKSDYYLIVNLDTKNSTYSIIPYDGELFLNGGKNEK